MGIAWQPGANIKILKRRAEIIKKIRNFFESRDFLEVETPSLANYPVTDVYLENIIAKVNISGELVDKYLQTSPEYAMKRLLAAGSGNLFQISKAFRDDECGRLHNHEFTMLEWYHLDFDHHQLMDEVNDFLQEILNCERSNKYSYRQLFEDQFKLNPHTVSAADLKLVAVDYNFDNVGIDDEDKDSWLNLLFSHVIEPQLGRDSPSFVYDYPVSQASLAKIRLVEERVASRFEVYYRGIELANGFHELTDHLEQKRRFEHDIKKRQKLGLGDREIDPLFLAALTSGLPECSGVALGIDRLIMLVLNKKSIHEVISFSEDLATVQ